MEGEIANDFLTILIQKHFDTNYYIFVSPNPELLPEHLKEGDKAYSFDPCASRKLKEILSEEITDAYIITHHIQDRQNIYQTLREYSKNMQITLLGEIQVPEDPQLLMVNERVVLSLKLFEKFPNVPRTARYIGLGSGELMQVNVPFGSPYAYRTIGVIKQKKWKIAAVYRKGELILPKYSTVIYPNDSLLLVGEPATLWEIYHRIKDEIGQFPVPFGRDVVLFLDMSLETLETLDSYLEQTLWLFNKFTNKRLYLIIFNATSFEYLQKLKHSSLFNQENITLLIEFYEVSFQKILTYHKNAKNIGLILTTPRFFKTHKKLLLECGIPLLKFGETPLFSLLSSSVILPQKTEEAEKISSVVFDFSTQAGFKIQLYDFEPDSNFHKQAIEYYQHIAKIFEKKFTLLESNTTNPILWLKNQKDTIQILPLKKESPNKALWFSLMEVEVLSMRLEKIPQLYVPLSV